MWGVRLVRPHNVSCEIVLKVALAFLISGIASASQAARSDSQATHGATLSHRVQQHLEKNQQQRDIPILQRPGQVLQNQIGQSSLALTEPLDTTIVVETTNYHRLRGAARRHGAKLMHRHGDRHEVTIPTSRLKDFAQQLPLGTSVRFPYPHAPAAIISQGVEIIGAGDLHSLGTDGNGVTIAIIDLGFVGASAAQAAGELPVSMTLLDCTQPGCSGSSAETGTNHGTNVAQIAHDVAPGATVILVKVASEAQLQTAVDFLINNSAASVIVHSVSWYSAAYYDGTGPLCDIANTAETAGIQWVNSMGNDRQNHYAGLFTDLDLDDRHEFASGQNFNTVNLVAGQLYELSLSWDEYLPFSFGLPQANIDYQLYLFDGDPDAGGTQVASSENLQVFSWPNGFPDPVEIINYTPTNTGTYYIAVEGLNPNPSVEFKLFSIAHALGVQTPTSSLPQPADCQDVIAVAATNYASDVVEAFSSEGPTTDGRFKPEVAAPDRVQTSLAGSFTGTSAAAPHVGGAVALLQAANPGLGTISIRNLLRTTAIDVGVPGPDFSAGDGRVSLDADADGENHDFDNCPVVANSGQADSDGDGVGDACDNCITTANPAQYDSNADGYGNHCDIDLNGDGLINAFDINLFVAGFFSSDPDLDLNGDGLINAFDINQFVALFFQPLGPSAFAP